MDETSELVAMLGAVAGIIVATGGLFKVVPPIIDACKGIGCDCNFGIVKCKCCMGMCNPIMNPTNSRDTDEVDVSVDVGDEDEHVNP